MTVAMTRSSAARRQSSPARAARWTNDVLQGATPSAPAEVLDAQLVTGDGRLARAAAAISDVEVIAVACRGRPGPRHDLCGVTRVRAEVEHHVKIEAQLGLG